MKTPAFSFFIEAASLPPGGRTYELRASAEECRAIAAELGIEAVKRLDATLALSPGPGGFVNVSGRFEADVVQACVVSLQPVEASIGGSIIRRFGPVEAVAEEGGWVDPEAEDDVDALSDGRIDLGHIVTEELALALDPYPRAPGAQFSSSVAAQPTAEAGPFAALATLRTGRRRGTKTRRR